MKDPYHVPEDEKIPDPAPVPQHVDVGWLGIANYWRDRAKGAESQRILFYQRLIEERVYSLNWEKRCISLEQEINEAYKELAKLRETANSAPLVSSPPSTPDVLVDLVMITAHMIQVIKPDLKAYKTPSDYHWYEAKNSLQKIIRALGLKPMEETRDSLPSTGSVGPQSSNFIIAKGQ